VHYPDPAMMSTIQSPYTREQISVWLRGLLTVAWADGHFDIQEQSLIADLTHHDLTPEERSRALEPISPAELARALGADPQAAENFLRMAVMVALADGAYSFCEDETLYQYCQALGLETDILKTLRLTIAQGDEADPSSAAINTGVGSTLAAPPPGDHALDLHLFDPLREWLDKMDVQDPKLARFLCRMIPPQCPFERDINVFGRKVAHIPPLCKLNPLYEQLVGLRFRALCYLADQCGEDVAPYC